MKNLSIRLTDSEYLLLTEIAHAHRTNISDAFRLILTDYANRSESSIPLSLLLLEIHSLFKDYSQLNKLIDFTLLPNEEARCLFAQVRDREREVLIHLLNYRERL